MSILEELKERFQKAEQRKAELARAVMESSDAVRQKQELALRIEAADAADTLAAKQARFRELIREVPALVFDFDQAARDLHPTYRQIELAANSHTYALQGLLDRHFGVGPTGSYYNAGGRHCEHGHNPRWKLPDWVPLRTRPVLSAAGELIAHSAQSDDYHGTPMVDAIRQAWAKKEADHVEG